MPILLIVQLLGGFYALSKGADLLVDSASNIAKRFHIPDLVIGLTLVSLGTSLPELFVNTWATFQNKPDIIFGNIIGSNVSNICLILGITAFLKPLAISSKRLVKDTRFNIIIIITLITLLLSPIDTLILTFIKGGILLGLFIYFMVQMWSHTADYKKSLLITVNAHTLTKLKTAGLFCLGIILLPIGANYVIQSAIKIATLLQISEAFIALFAIAIGTSLPELVTTVVAARKGHTELALGNIIGSNIFNILLILGINALLRPIPFNSILIVDLILLLLVTIILFLMIKVRKTEITKKDGILLLCVYLSYVAFLFYRG